MPPPEPVAQSIFRLAVLYLSDAGWYRDGDDLGEWHVPRGGVPCGPASMAAGWRTFGDALTLQLEADGVSLLEAVSLG